MVLQLGLRRYSHIHERLPEFAAVATELVIALGLEKTGGRGPKGEPASDRVIRDYVRRRVLSPTLRGPAGDERGFYGFRHLVEFLAARVLLNDGWPLEKIAERNREAATEELLSLIPGEPEENPALALARSFRNPVPSRPRLVEYSRSQPLQTDPDAADEQQPLAGIAWQPGRAAKLRAELPMLMRQITGDARLPTVRQRVSIEFGDQIVLMVDQALLDRLSTADAEAIGRAISAALINYPHLVRPKEPR